MAGMIAFSRVPNRPRLRTGQAKLYVLLCSAVADGRPVNRSEVFEIYKRHVADGEGLRLVDWDRARDRPVTKVLPWTDFDWEVNFRNWFLRALGTLVISGYLKAIPAISLCDMPSSIDQERSTWPTDTRGE